MPIWVLIEVIVLLTVINGFIGSVSRWTAIVLAGLWLVFSWLSGALLVPTLEAQLTAWLPALAPFLGAEIGRAIRKHLKKADAVEVAASRGVAAERENQLQQRKALQEMFLRLRRPKMTAAQIASRLGTKRLAVVASRVGLTPAQVAARLAVPNAPNVRRPIQVKGMQPKRSRLRSGTEQSPVLPKRRIVSMTRVRPRSYEPRNLFHW